MFNQRKNKRFNYTPRHDRDLESSEEPSFREKWQNSRVGSGRGKAAARRGLIRLVVILGMIIVFWYLLTHYETS